jgi:hypothetical protein
MIEPSQRADVPRLSDSPWFWAMLFGAAGAIILLVAAPKYAKRQRGLEMQYYARQEIARRQVEGQAVAREPGQEGSAPPPEPGQLVIGLWPLVVVSTTLFAISATMLWRSRRALGEPARRSNDRAPS